MDPFEIVRLSDIHKIVAPEVERLLGPKGFVSFKDLRWVRSADAPIRQLFCLFQWKGGQVAPSWGLSLDFVPHLSGNAVNWHRTPKSAIFDLCVDARDRALDIPYCYGKRIIEEKSTAVITEAVKRASKFWKAVRSNADLPAAFEWVKEYLSGPGLGFDNYTQHPLAFALALALNGRVEEGAKELDQFFKRDGLSEKAKSRLCELFLNLQRTKEPIQG